MINPIQIHVRIKNFSLRFFNIIVKFLLLIMEFLKQFLIHIEVIMHFVFNYHFVTCLLQLSYFIRIDHLLKVNGVELFRIVIFAIIFGAFIILFVIIVIVFLFENSLLAHELFLGQVKEIEEIPFALHNNNYYI